MFYLNFIRKASISQKKFLFDTLKHYDIEQCSKNLAKCFVPIQICKLCNLGEDQLIPLMRNIAKVGVKRNLSFKAVDLQNGNIAGVFLNFDIVDQHQFQATELITKYNQYNQLFGILNDVSHDELQKEGAFQEPGKWVHIWIGGVFKQYQGNKLARRLLDYSLKNFKERGYKYSCTQLVSPESQQVFINSSKYYKELKKIKYNQYVYEGQKAFPRGTGHVSFAVCELDSLRGI